MSEFRKAVTIWTALFMATALNGQGLFDNPLISEFVANPGGELETEWVELYNPTAFDIDLQYYRIGDELGWCNISDTVLLLAAYGYIVLAQDPARFMEFYTDFNGRVASPTGWQILNNSGDVVRLGDLSETSFDSIIYTECFDDNRSWERYVDGEGDSHWGGSFDPSGSTPGRLNSYIFPRTKSIEIEISPDPFSPDGDGFEDVAVIKFNPPEATSFDLSIYDLSGRKVKSFLAGDASIPGEITWDGRDNSGKQLPVGIYIVYARTQGESEMEAKQTVVIAR